MKLDKVLCCWFMFAFLAVRAQNTMVVYSSSEDLTNRNVLVM